MNNKQTYAPGKPGISAKWTSSKKTGIGTALSDKSNVWFTIGEGIINEVYYPRIDQATIRDMQLIVTDGHNFFSEEKSDTNSDVSWEVDGVPTFNIVNNCREGCYSIKKSIVTDTAYDSLLQQIKFTPKKGELSDYKVHVLLAPHLENHGEGNTAWVGVFKNTKLLFAQRGQVALALACSAPWLKRSAGYVGYSDGWQDLYKHKEMTWEYSRAEDGNVALTAGVDIANSNGEFVLSVGFGGSSDEAAKNAISSLKGGFDKAKKSYVSGWKKWMKTHVTKEDEQAASGNLSPKSLAVLRTHESKTIPGGIIASLSIPWGFDQNDNDQGGYHVIWSRDMVEAACALLATGAHADMKRVISYLKKTQKPDGHWPQNMWLNGQQYWDGIQMDETALPILLVDLAYRENALTKDELKQYWPMVKNAAGYLVRNGPVSQEDRWEEDPGYTPFTVAAQIAALLAAADSADLKGETTVGTYLREVADVWYSCIDRWMYAKDDDWCRKFDVDGYYVRIAPNDATNDATWYKDRIIIKNVNKAKDNRRAEHVISPDALALVRFGLRAPDDPHIISTVKLIDSLLKTNTPMGDIWHRYNNDGYGEHADGSAFNGTGIGRGWPLLTGERAHFELANGNSDYAKNLATSLEKFANQGGMIPEQVWDTNDIPDKDLYFGKATGSAMPLVWAHAEYLKLRRSLHDGKIFDLPPQTVKRYLVGKTISNRMIWRFNHKIRTIPTGKTLRIETLSPAIIHWSTDDWQTTNDIKTRSIDLGINLADLATESLTKGAQVKFTFFWPQENRWENVDYTININSEND